VALRANLIASGFGAKRGRAQVVDIEPEAVVGEGPAAVVTSFSVVLDAGE
jgi:hypothetical protein